MSYLPGGEAIPLIVVGRQRAGTRYITDVLNAFDEVTIQGEIPNPVMHAMVRMMKEINQYYSGAAEDPKRGKRGAAEYERWLARRQDFVFSAWANFSQNPRRAAAPSCRYYGYKRPKHETYFRFYKRIFGANEPIYIYCIRNFRDNYLSIVSRWPDRTIEDTANAYAESLKVYEEMRQEIPKRVLIFNLDDLKIAGFSYVEEQILAPLGLHAEGNFRAILAAKGAANTTERDNGAVRRRDLTEKEEAFIRSRPELDGAFQRLCRHYDLSKSRVSLEARG